MTYRVYVGQAKPLYEQTHQLKSFLKRFDFKNYAITWIAREPFYSFLRDIGTTWDVYAAPQGRKNSLYGPYEVEILIRVYINFELESDAIQFKLTYDPNEPEF